MIFTLCSVLAVFECRFYTVCVFPQKPFWEFWRHPWLISHYALNFLGVLGFIFWIPEQQTAKKWLFKVLTVGGAA
ncbi:hypothetical protein CAEBREN_29175 [Caenorhabditis brenneri]|uniref:Uncharacterized protein n=1 Tax=Caenorhabditis brenneri TaxID=135651 RepID=G0PHF3_CAEBE|nr:hypothetical protein CAEBREN_29175 [Caenorhabditis brenneri]